MKKIYFISLIAGVLLFSGCTVLPNDFWSEPKKEIIYIEQEGTVQKSQKNIFSNQYILQGDSGKILSILRSNTYDLSDFLEKEVVIKGEIITDEELPNTLILEIVQMAEVQNYSTKEKFFPSLGLSIPISKDITIEEKNKRVLLSRGEQKEKFIHIKAITDTNVQKKFLTTGEKISLGKNTAYRLFAIDKTQLLYSPQNIMFEFWGTPSELHQFYTLAEQVIFTDSQDTIPSPSSSHSPLTPISSSPDNIALITYIQKNLATILEIPSSIRVQKIALYQSNLLDIEYQKQEEKKRVILSYTNVDGKFIFSQQASYIVGSETSWTLDTGEHPVLAGTSEIFLADVDTLTPLILPDNFALYVSTHYNFQIGYPRQMYYQSTGKTEKFLAELQFSYSPVTAKNTTFRVEILDGALKKKRESISDITIWIPRNERTHFVLSAAEPKDWVILQSIAKTLRND